MRQTTWENKIRTILKSHILIIFLPLFTLTLILSASFPLYQMAEAAKKNQISISPQNATDYIHSIIEANRTVYAEVIVERLGFAIGLSATENWKHEKTLLLPAQFLLMGSKLSNARKSGMTYKLKSLWPINHENKPNSDFEEKGLEEVSKNPDSTYTKIVNINGQRYFKAVYADKAVTKACVQCHNNHLSSPKKDHQLDEVMGGVIISIPLPRRKRGDKDEETQIPAEVVSGYIYSILTSDREIYSKYLVDRLQKENVVFASENWWEENSLPLPAQFLLNSSELTKAKQLKLQFELLSQWAINPINKPNNKYELAGLENLANNEGMPYFSSFKNNNGETYFQAIYPDFAVSEACVECHNSHLKSPKRNFKLGDLMGGLMLTILIH